MVTDETALLPVGTLSDSVPEPSFTKSSELLFQFVCFNIVLNVEQNLIFVTLPSILMLILVIAFQSSRTTIKSCIQSLEFDMHLKTY